MSEITDIKAINDEQFFYASASQNGLDWVVKYDKVAGVELNSEFAARSLLEAMRDQYLPDSLKCSPVIDAEFRLNLLKSLKP